MHLRYHDILSRIPERPKWWFNGVPRYDAFEPDLIGTYEVALVRTKCQSCGARYDIAEVPSGPFRQSFRPQLAFTNSIGGGDPPNACDFVGGGPCIGYCMGAYSVELLEFWFNEIGYGDNWQRDKTLERPLDDARYDDTNPLDLKPSVSHQLLCWKDIAKWDQAKASRDLSAMTDILRQFDCEIPEEVAKMIDLQATYSKLHRGLLASIENDSV